MIVCLCVPPFRADEGEDDGVGTFSELAGVQEESVLAAALPRSVLTSLAASLSALRHTSDGSDSDSDCEEVPVSWG